MGDVVTFGRYEQDSNLDNGPEAIEWIVLDVQDGKALLLSRYGLDAKPYNTTRANVTWETCTLRDWLNGDFINLAFAGTEQSAILWTDVDNSMAQGFDWTTVNGDAIAGGNNTRDRIFLLSGAEANRYLGVDINDHQHTEAAVERTAYAIRNGAGTDEDYGTGESDANGWWWLRSPGGLRDDASCVTSDGSVIPNYFDRADGCVRPAFWIDPESGVIVHTGTKVPVADEIGTGDAPSTAVNAEPAADETPKVTEQGESGISPLREFKTVGNIVTFGRYEQDNNMDNGPEAIEWIVLDVQGGKALLLSRYGLDAKPYNTEDVDVTWETCTLRAWLNGDFRSAAFTEKEQSAILLTDVDNGKAQGYSGWIMDGGNNTQDQVFLLSYAEANRCLGVTWDGVNNTDSQVKPTAWAVGNGAKTNRLHKTAEGDPAGWWWLRSHGDLQGRAATVYYNGLLYASYMGNVHACVRPAIWIDLESDIF